jgi:drug/metabolite transporter (DMT)-like permease
MYWKLRVPIMFLIIGVVGGLNDRFPKAFFEGSSFWIRGLFYIVLYGIILWILEKTKITKKKVHFTIGILLFVLGMIIQIIIISIPK